MNAGVASQTRLGLSRLVVGATGRRQCRKVRRWRVALETDGVHVDPVEHVCIWPSVREVAESAASGLHDGVLIDERTSNFSVALDAKSVLFNCWLEDLLLVRAMRVVTI